MPKLREIYSPEFKQEAVELVKTTGKGCAEVARDLGLLSDTVLQRKIEFYFKRSRGTYGTLRLQAEISNDDAVQA